VEIETTAETEVNGIVVGVRGRQLTAARVASSNMIPILPVATTGNESAKTDMRAETGERTEGGGIEIADQDGSEGMKMREVLHDAIATCLTTEAAVAGEIGMEVVVRGKRRVHPRRRRRRSLLPT
jgi:hypothetical protein